MTLQNKEDYIVKSQLEPTIIPDLTLSEFFYKRLTSTKSDIVAIINALDGSEITYGQLNDRIKRRALGLIKSGLMSTDLAMFFAENSVEYLITMLAFIYLGVPFTPLKPASGAYELMNQVKDSQASVLLIDHPRLEIFLKVFDENKARKQFKLLFLVDSCSDTEEIDCHPKFFENIQLIDDHNNDLNRIPYFDVGKNDHLIIVYTSGTTGLPKGAIHTQYSVLGSMIAFKPIDQSTNIVNRSLLWYPFGHVSGFFKSLKELCWGMTIVLEPNRGQLSYLISSVAKFRISHMPISPSHAVQLTKYDFEKEYDLECLREISFAGSKISLDILNEIEKKYKVHISELYGATEMMGSVLQLAKNNPPGSVGVVWTNNEMKIIDLQNGQSLPAQKQGEICFRGPPRFYGYLRNEKATKEVIDSEGWYHTGDIGYYDLQGHLYVVDRIKELIKFRHWTISPVEIEVFLQGHWAINSVCIVGVRHSTDGQLIRAYIQLRDGLILTEAEIIQFVQENLGFHKRLRGGVRFVNEMIRTSIGKIDRKYYHQMVADELITDPIL